MQGVVCDRAGGWVRGRGSGSSCKDGEAKRSVEQRSGGRCRMG